VNAECLTRTLWIHPALPQCGAAGWRLGLVALLVLGAAGSPGTREWANAASTPMPTLLPPPPTAQPRGPEPALRDAIWPALARVDHRAVHTPQDGYAEVSHGYGSATVVGPRTLLTHGHYALWRDPSLYDEELVLDLSAGGVLFPVSLDLDACRTPYADRGTMLIVVPRTFPMPPAVPLGRPGRLQEGDPVTIYYWDDAEARFAALQSTLFRIEKDSALLVDPDHVLGPGDSGSPAFDGQGRLIGNLKSVFYDALGPRLPRARIALLPSGIGGWIE